MVCSLSPQGHEPRDMDKHLWEILQGYIFLSREFREEGHAQVRRSVVSHGMWPCISSQPAALSSVFISLTDWYLRRWDREKQRQRQRWRETERKRERRREGERWQCAVREVDNKGSMSWFQPLTLSSLGSHSPPPLLVSHSVTSYSAYAMGIHTAGDSRPREEFFVEFTLFYGNIDQIHSQCLGWLEQCGARDFHGR